MSRQALGSNDQMVVDDAINSPAMTRQFRSIVMSALITIVLLGMAMMQKVDTTGIALLAMAYVLFTAIEKWRYLCVLRTYRRVIAKLATQEEVE